MKKLGIKQIAITGVFLAICIVSMFFKNANVYVTGTIVNSCIILVALTAGIIPAIILSVVTPVFSFIITGSPIIAAIPIIMFIIMIGNVILCSVVYTFDKRIMSNRSLRLLVPMIIASILKAIFMGVVISLIIVPSLLPQKMMAMKPVIQMTFSVVQLVTALIASVVSTVIYKFIGKTFS